MKAQTFLEWSKNKPSLDYYGGAIFDIVDFYSQPFKPELITELFEGWVYSKGNGGYEKDGILVWFYNNWTLSYRIIAQKPQCSPSSLESLFYPQTLNDFISDCQRAGIELTWKPEIERKYFV